MAGLLNPPSALAVDCPPDRAEADLLWEIRRAASPALYALSPGKLNEDVCVPLSGMKDLPAAPPRSRSGTGSPSPRSGMRATETST